MIAQAFNSDSKEAIRERMLEHAAVLWDVKNPQALDPFVRLLMESFSTELFRLSNEAEQVESRLVEKLARLLTPSIYTIPQPAHAIAYTFPTDPIHILSNECELKHTINLPSQEKRASGSSIAVNFTPVDRVELSKIKVTSVIAGYSYQCFDAHMNRSLFKRIATPVNYGELWLALDVSGMDSTFPDSLSLYFANPSHEHINWIYQLLPYMSASIGDHLLEVGQGLHYIHGDDYSGYEAIFNDFDIQKRIADNVKSLYDPQFVTLSKFPAGLHEQLVTLPAELQPHIAPGDAAAAFRQPCLWVKLKLPPQYTFEILEQFLVCANAFPVINRTWEQKDYKLGAMGNNIPIVPATGSYFLSVQKVQDEDGHFYTEIPYGSINNLQTGLYSIKRGGLERYDERRALDIGNYILELARDEVTAFSEIVTGNGINPVKEMVAQMKRLERILREKGNFAREVPTYIVIEPLVAATMTHVGYWVSHGPLANNFRASMMLKAENGAALHDGKVVLLTSSRGGAAPQTGINSINAYRYALTSRDRIVTFLDIKNFCHYELKDAIREIIIEKGIDSSPKPKEGFVRTTDIYITVVQYDHYPKAYWQLKERELLLKINARAVDGIRRRLFIKPEQTIQ